MADPVRPPSLILDMEAFARRLKNMEGANRQANGGISGGAMLLYTEDGTAVGYIGEVASGVVGLQLTTPDGLGLMFHVSSFYGWAGPYLHASWVKPNEVNAPAGGTFEAMWRTMLEQALGLHVRFRTYITTPAGTTGEVRVLLGGNPIGNTLTVGASHGAYHEFSAPIGGVLFAGPYEMNLEARLTAGAGPLNVYRPFDAFQGKHDDVVPVTGWWT